MQKDGESDVLKMKRLSERMRAAVWHHIAIPVALGARNMGLADKWSAIMHALRIEADGWEMVAALVLICACLTTDYGTESEIGIVPALDPRRIICSAWSGRGTVDDTADNRDRLDTAADILISFARAFRIPGTDHIFHNALDQVTDHLPSFKDWYQSVKALGQFLGSRYYVDRFVSCCFNVSGAEASRRWSKPRLNSRTTSGLAASCRS